MFDQPVSSLPHVQAGKLKVLGISSGQRFPTLKEIPTVAEQGLPGFEAISWAGVCAPGGTPADRRSDLQRSRQGAESARHCATACCATASSRSAARRSNMRSTSKKKP